MHIVLVAYFAIEKYAIIYLFLNIFFDGVWFWNMNKLFDDLKIFNERNIKLIKNIML